MTQMLDDAVHITQPYSVVVTHKWDRSDLVTGSQVERVFKEFTKV